MQFEILTVFGNQWEKLFFVPSLPTSKSKPAENLYIELERLTLISIYWNLV